MLDSEKKEESTSNEIRRFQTIEELQVLRDSKALKKSQHRGLYMKQMLDQSMQYKFPMKEDPETQGNYQDSTSCERFKAKL